MSCPSENITSESSYATLDPMVSRDTNLRVRPSTGNIQKGFALGKVFDQETFYIKWNNSKVVMFRPADIVDSETHSKISIDSMSWDKFREEIETRLDIKLHGKIMQAIVENESGYKKPPIYVTDGASWRAVLHKFHCEENNECFFIITSPEGIAHQNPSRGRKCGWSLFFVFMLVVAVLSLLMVNVNSMLSSTPQEYPREVHRLLKL